MLRLPRVFIGSSTESFAIAAEIEKRLTDDADITTWKDAFDAGDVTIDRLITLAAQCDFAILILSADDVLRSRDQYHASPRDNVLLELGLFLGRLGRSRTLVVHERDVDLKFPSDLDGITKLSYRKRERLPAAVSPACTDIRRRIQELGPLRDEDDGTGILEVFANRQDSKLFASLRRSIQDAGEFRYLSISGRQVFDNTYHHPCWALISDPNVSLDILLLDPTRSAIEHRCTYERVKSSRTDIEQSLGEYLPILLRSRVDRWRSGRSDRSESLEACLARSGDLRDLGCVKSVSVKLYDETPAVHLLAVGADLFVEQYHLADLGEPEMVDMAGMNCIGRQVPVTRYDQRAKAARLLLSHFRRLRRESTTIDITEQLFRRALDLEPL
jgi:hypothetical protein